MLEPGGGTAPKQVKELFVLLPIIVVEAEYAVGGGVKLR
jgi:hypothetical protein